MKETTPEEVLKVMRHDNKKLDEQLDELEALEANLRKASELIAGAVIAAAGLGLGQCLHAHAEKRQEE